ncbi:peroxiredoxin [Roseimicrobium gellanilyticum]|uniref:Peroxiredoxin n=1 Tax=Roseimicrobium gellanilyticum TaxID=748857 RepID=A0A366HWX3_9BACT|nr:redoxin domain-containing protein [Roseimicrobium gellanilyticum]RBP47985.1 peroxiredoxin [Roseimicrobium gellanilyticum]
MSFIENPARWIMIIMAMALAAVVYWISWALDRIQVAIVEKKEAVTAKAEAPIPTSMDRLYKADWETGRRFLKPSTDEEAFSQGPFMKEDVLGTGAPGNTVPFTSSNPTVSSLMQMGTLALHTLDSSRAERCFRTAATEDPQCAGAWIGLAIANETQPGRATYFLDKAEAASGKGAVEVSWTTAYRSFFASAESGDLGGRLEALAAAFDSIASAQNQDAATQLFAVRYRILAHHLVDAPLPQSLAMDGQLDTIGNAIGVGQVAPYGVLLWLKRDARRAVPYARSIDLERAGAVGFRLAAAPLEAVGDWRMANQLLSVSLSKLGNSPEDFENARLLSWALYHQGDADAALKLANDLRQLPRRPHFNPDRQPDVDPGDAFVEARRLRAQLLMAAGRWEELGRTDALTDLDEAGCQLAMAQTHYWRAIAFAAQGFAQNANNQLDELRQITEKITANSSMDRHRELAESMARGAEAFIELAGGHISAYVGDILDVPAVALAPFFAKAGDPGQAQQLLEKELRNHPASIPVAAMLRAAKEGQPLTLPKPAPSTMSQTLVVASPLPAPGFTLPDETGSTVGMEKWQGQYTLVIFQAGGSRPEDAAPLKELRTHAPSFAHFGIPIVVVSTEEATMLLEALGLTGTPSPKLPFNMLSDRQQFAFKSWGCYDQYLEKPLHGAFLVDRQSSILWSNVSHQSCIQPEYLLLESQRLIALQKEKETPPADQGGSSTPPPQEKAAEASTQTPAEEVKTN